MKNNEKGFDWNDITDIWKESSHSHDIQIRLSELLTELKDKSSHFERHAIENDLVPLKANWLRFKQLVSQYEKDLIKKDVAIVTSLLKKFLRLFKKGHSN